MSTIEFDARPLGDLPHVEMRTAIADLLPQVDELVKRTAEWRDGSRLQREARMLICRGADALEKALAIIEGSEEYRREEAMLPTADDVCGILGGEDDEEQGDR